MTGKKNDSMSPQSEAAQPLTKTQRAALEAELAYHDESAAALERNGNTKTYHHERGAAIRAMLESEAVDNAKLD